MPSAFESHHKHHSPSKTKRDMPADKTPHAMIVKKKKALWISEIPRQNVEELQERFFPSTLFGLMIGSVHVAIEGISS